MSDEHGPFRDAFGPDVEFAHRVGCVRIGPGTLQDHPTNPALLVCAGLYVHTDAGHISTGLTTVSIQKSDGRIRLDTDGATNGAPIITGDETAAASRLMFGASGGNGYVSIVVSNDSGPLNLANQTVYNSVASGALNMWVAFHSQTNRSGEPSRISELEDRVASAENALAAVQDDLAAAVARIAVLEQTSPTVNVTVSCPHACASCPPPTESTP